MNICIVQMDALRADHLGCYGYNKGTSPNIDAIARNSLLFETAISQANWTYQSVYSMISGRYPSVLQLNWFDQKINQNFTVLPEFLAGRGYHTGIFSMFKMLLNPAAFGSHFNDRENLELGENTPGFVKKWLAQNEHNFLFFHIGEYTHEPFYVDKKYVADFLDSGIDGASISKSPVIAALTSRNETAGDTSLIRGIIGKINKGLIKLKPDEIKYLLACYDAGIFYVDNIVGEIYRMLKAQSDDYIFILTADHGQYFLEHGYFGHGRNLYDEVIRVPLIIDYNNKCSRRVPELVQLMDIFPTLLELLGMECDFKQDGVSFAPVFNGGKLGRRIAVSEGYPYLSLRDDNYKLITLYSKLWGLREAARRSSYNKASKLILLKKNLLGLSRRFSADEFYSLSDDKTETINLRSSEKELYKAFKRDLRRILDDIKQDGLPSCNVKLDNEVRQQLKSLGYL